MLLNQARIYTKLSQKVIGQSNSFISFLGALYIKTMYNKSLFTYGVLSYKTPWVVPIYQNNLNIVRFLINHCITNDILWSTDILRKLLNFLFRARLILSCPERNLFRRTRSQSLAPCIVESLDFLAYCK